MFVDRRQLGSQMAEILNQIQQAALAAVKAERDNKDIHTVM